jgi:flagellar L-ring protein precursor FlgH
MWLVWCSLSLALAKKPAPAPPAPTPPVVASPAVAVPVAPGSLWSEVSARRLMGLDAGARQVGDLVTVLVYEQTATTIDAQTDLSRLSESAAAINALFGAEKRITEAHPDMNGTIALGASSASQFNGEGGTTRGSSVETWLTCSVIEVLPTGNLRLWGYKQVRVNRETQYVVLTGIVRPRDIQMDNTVVSDRLAEAVFEITGSGVVADKQGPGLFSRVLDAVWPF